MKFTIKQKDDKWCLYNSEGTEIIGCHSTKEDALAQERAIKANMSTDTPIEFEAFAVGVWNGMRFGSADLEDIAKNFKALVDLHKVPLKFGHNNEQKMTDGQPSLGWVTDAWVDGNKLMLRAEHVPSIVRNAIEKKLYRKVSIEVDFDVEHKGKKYSHVLSGVALLGADIPAVNTLADLDHYLDKAPRLAASRRGVFSSIDGNLTKEEMGMTKEEIEQMVNAAVAPLKTQLAEKDTELSKLRAKEEFAAKEARAAKVKFARDTVTAVFDDAIKAGKLTPAKKASYSKILNVDNDDAVMAIDIESVKQLVGSETATFSAGSSAHSKADNQADDAGEEIVRLAKLEIDKVPTMTFSRAMEVVMQREVELAKTWLG